MPHACISVKRTVTAEAATPAPPTKGTTHICESLDSKTTYCHEPVTEVDQPVLTTCHPDNHGPTCGGCESECHKKHPHFPA